MALRRQRADAGRHRMPGMGAAWWLPGLPLLALLVLPLLALLLEGAGAGVLRSLGAPAARRAIGLSLQTSFATVLLTVTLGTPLAFVLARRSFPLKKLVETLLDLPMVLPPAVAGVALLLAFGRTGLVGTWLAPLGIQIPFTPVAVVMAQTFVAAPLFIRAALIGLAAVPEELEEVALLDGAGTAQVLRHVTLPLAGPALLGGAVLTWARALGEFGATIIFAGNLPGHTQTMPLAIYLGFELDLHVALALSVLLVALSFAVLALVRSVLAR